MMHTKDQKSKSRSPRQLKVGEELRHALAAELQKGEFPWDHPTPRPIITVTEVRVSPDLRNANAFIMPLGGKQAKEVERALNTHIHYFKNVIARNVHMRYIPQLHFNVDTSFEYATKIERILSDPEVARDLRQPPDQKA
jgi:ribosome-binding factor A